MALEDELDIYNNPLFQNPQSGESYMQKFAQMMNSPERKAKLEEMQKASQAAIDQQKEGVAQNEALVKQLEPRSQGANIQPLLNLADSWTGSKLAQGYVSPDDYKERVLALRNQLQGQKKGLSDEQLTLMKNSLGGSDLKTLVQQMAMGTRLDQRNRALGLSSNKYANQVVDKDPLLNSYTQRSDGATKALELIGGVKNGDIAGTEKVLNQLNGEIARLETGAQAVGEKTVEGTSMKDQAAHFQGIIDSFKGAQTDAVRADLWKQAEALVKNLNDSYNNQIDRRYQQLKSGKDASQQKIIGDKHNKFKEMSGFGSSKHPVDGLSDEEVVKAYNKKMGIK